MAVRQRDGKPLEEILSAAERQVFEQLKAGATDEEISERMDLGIATVRYHVRNSIRKMEVADREALLALESGPGTESTAASASGAEVQGRPGGRQPRWLLAAVLIVAAGAGFGGGLASGWFRGDDGAPVAPAEGARGADETGEATPAGAGVDATRTATPTPPPSTQQGTAAAATPTPAATPTATPITRDATPVGVERGDGAPRVVFWGEVPTGYRVYVHNRTAEVVQFFEERFQVRVPGLTIHVGADAPALLEATREALGETWHVGLARYREGLLFIDVEARTWAIDTLYFQAIQEQLAGQQEWGPWWLSEGAAVYGNYLFRDWRGHGTVEDDLRLARWHTSFDDRALKDFEGGSPTASRVFGTTPQMVAAVAVSWLVEGAGEDSLVAYYRAIGESGDWRAAFESTFGLPFEEVYAGFAAYRAEVAGPRRTVQGRILALESESLQGRTLHIGARRHGSDSIDYGVVDDRGRFELYIPDGTYALAVVCPGFVTIGWHGGESGFTRDEGEATEVVVAGGIVTGIVIALPAPPEELSGACETSG